VQAVDIRHLDLFPLRKKLQVLGGGILVVTDDGELLFHRGAGANVAIIG